MTYPNIVKYEFSDKLVSQSRSFLAQIKNGRTKTQISNW